MNIFYQLSGFGALIDMGHSYWQNDKRTVLLWPVVANLIFAIHYTLLHARSGALCSFFQIVVLLLFLLQEMCIRDRYSPDNRPSKGGYHRAVH